MSNAVSDSSPLIHMAAVGRLSLLFDYYPAIAIPPAVWREVVEQGGGRQGVEEIRHARNSGLITIITPQNDALIKTLLQDLHEGEAEAITLALELHARVCILDDTEARRCAEQHGIFVIGIIGILLQAKADGRITSIREEMERLQNAGHFWISKSLRRMILSAADEI